MPHAHKHARNLNAGKSEIYFWKLRSKWTEKYPKLQSFCSAFSWKLLFDFWLPAFSWHPILTTEKSTLYASGTHTLNQKSKLKMHANFPRVKFWVCIEKFCRKVSITNKNVHKIICKWTILWITQKFNSFEWETSKDGERQTNRFFFVECVLSAFRHNIFGLLSNNLLRFINYSHIFISFRVSEWMNGWECACACPRTMRMKQRRMDSDRNPFLHVQNIKVLKYIILCECERQCCRWRWWWWRRRRLLLLFLVQPHPPFLNFILFLLFFSFHNLVLFHFSIHICYGILLPQSQVFYWKVYFVRKNNDDDTYHGWMCQKFMHVVCVHEHFAFSPNGIHNEWIMETEWVWE